MTRLHYVWKFIKTSFKATGFNAKMSSQMSKAALECYNHIDYIEREDLTTDHFEEFIAHILGVFSCVISYHESISFLCLSGHALNSSLLLRSQLEAYLIFYYLIAPKRDISEVKKRVDLYRDWVMVKMYNNSKKSKNFELFTINPQHPAYLLEIERNYEYVKEKYSETPSIFKWLSESQSFLKDKREVARQCEIEDLYLAIFSETSATVHLADISDRMEKTVNSNSYGYTYKLNSDNEAMMMSGIANILLLNAIIEFSNFFEFSKQTKANILKEIKITRAD